MNQITKQWIAKAEGNWASAQRALYARENPYYDLACFQAHEVVEKYLKARLQEAEVSFDRTLDLKKTMALAFNVEPAWRSLRPELSQLAVYTIDYLYPGKDATKADAEDAIESCRRVRQVMRADFGLPD